MGLFFGSAGKKWILTIVDQAIVSVAGFSATVIIARTCAKEQLGLYLLGLSIVVLMMEVQNVLIWSPYTALSPRLNGSARAFYTGSTFVHQWGFSVFSILALAGTVFFLTRGWGPPGLESVVWMLALVGPFITFREYARQVCFASFKMQAVLMLDSFATFITIGGLLVFAYWGRLSAAYALGVMGFGCGLAAIAWLIRFRKEMKFSSNRVFLDLRNNWSFGKWILGGNLVFFMGSQLYPWILAGFHGTPAVGILAACQGIVALANPFLYGTGNFLGPRAAQAFAHGGEDELRRLVKKSTLMIVAVISLFCAAIIVFGDNLVVFIYGSQYGGYNWVITILALDTLVIGLALSSDYGIWAMGRPDLHFRIEIVRLVITFTIGLWFVRRLGPLGVACGLLAGNAIVFMCQYLIFRKITQVT